MYKAVLKYALYAAFAIFCIACAKDAPQSGAVSCVQFNASVDDIYVSKAEMGDGSKVNTCTMELFYDGQSVGQYVSPVTDGKASFTVSVVAGRTYSAAFWAQKEGSYTVSDLRDVRYAGSYDVADDSMDAFCARCIDFTVQQDSSSPIQVSLTRPFAMVRVTLASGPFTSAGFTAPSSYNVLDDTLGDSSAFNYTNPEFYVFASSTKSYLDFGINGTQVQNVPIQRNRKTNINIQ